MASFQQIHSAQPSPLVLELAPHSSLSNLKKSSNLCKQETLCPGETETSSAHMPTPLGKNFSDGMTQVARAIHSHRLPIGGIPQVHQEVPGLELVLSADDERLHSLLAKQASLAQELEDITNQIASLNGMRGGMINDFNARQEIISDHENIESRLCAIQTILAFLDSL